MKANMNVEKEKLLHASTPDEHPTAGDIEAVKTRNAELEKMLAEKAEHLQRSIRYLEVEAALERVRRRTMAMHHSDELAETAAVLFQQLTG